MKFIKRNVSNFKKNIANWDYAVLCEANCFFVQTTGEYTRHLVEELQVRDRKLKLAEQEIISLKSLLQKGTPE